MTLTRFPSPNLVLKPANRKFESEKEKKEISAYWKQVEIFQSRHEQLTVEDIKEIFTICGGHFDAAEELVKADGDFSKVPKAIRDYLYSEKEIDRLKRGHFGIHSRESALDRLSFLGFDVKYI